MERLADAFLQSGQRHPRIRRQYAQALLDQGRISSALSVLDRLVADTARKDRRENAEAPGLLGRANKQMYVDGHGEASLARETLKRAIRRYYDVYRKAPSEYLWHGVNALAPCGGPSATARCAACRKRRSSRSRNPCSRGRFRRDQARRFRRALEQRAARGALGTIVGTRCCCGWSAT